MSPGLTTERIYLVLKARIMAGDLRAGERLDPARLAAELNASATPVRDALHQLFGENMVEAWPREGFRVPVPTEGGLRDLYEWHGELTRLLLSGWKGGETGLAAIAPRAADAPAQRAGCLFGAIARALGNSEHRRAIAHAADRLHRARRAEARVFPDLADEHAALVAAWCEGRAKVLRSGLARYHRRRQKQVAAIVAQILAEPRP